MPGATGLFANFILKTKHHNMLAPSLGEHFFDSFWCFTILSGTKLDSLGLPEG